MLYLELNAPDQILETINYQVSLASQKALLERELGKGISVKPWSELIGDKNVMCFF